MILYVDPRAARQGGGLRGAGEGAATRALRQIASQHPDYVEGAAKGGTFLVDNLRLASGGAFVADEKVADLQHVVEMHARQEVAEIKTRRKGRGVWGHLGPFGGYFVGAFAGLLVVGYSCQAAVGRARCDTAAANGAVVGAIAGLGYGFYAARRETEDVIYRAGRMSPDLHHGLSLSHGELGDNRALSR